MDRNTIIGFSLLAVLLGGYIFYNSYNQKQYLEGQRKKQIADSIALLKNPPKKALIDSTAILASQALNDSARKSLPPAFNSPVQNIKLENEKVAITFSSKGAHPVSALLKEYKTAEQKPLYLFSGEENKFSIDLPVNNGATTSADLYYVPTVSSLPNGDKVATFEADLGDGKKVSFVYTLPAKEYMMKCAVQLNGLSASVYAGVWQTASLHTEQDIANEKQSSQVYYRFNDKDNDYFTIGDDKKETFNTPVNWVGFRMHYFNSTLISDNGLEKTTINATTKTGGDTVAVNLVSFVLAAKGAGTQNFNFSWYIGPNHYKTLKSYGLALDNMVPLGYGFFAFVKYINKWIIIPVFDFLSGFITNYGIIIMLLTVFIRLILSFFTYKSYLSSAKMRVLKPELDELRQKLGDDQQKFGMEQMKLYRSAGVNPLGGCLPMVFQMPILFAMYYFFPSSIELRQKPFLWAHDLSTYDSIAHIPNIPFFGDHISLFTLLMTASSLFLALYSRNMTPQDPNNPMMKWMPFIFPIFLMGVFNKMAAALTFYYFFSNMLSILQQWIIQKLIIDEKKIHAQIQENRNKPATPSKWAQRIEEMQKSQANKPNQPRTNK